MHFAARSNGGEVWNSASGCLVLSASGRGTRDERDLLSRQREIAMAWTNNDDVRRGPGDTELTAGRVLYWLTTIVDIVEVVARSLR